MHHFLAAHGAAVEVEVGAYEVVAQVWRGAVDDFEREVVVDFLRLKRAKQAVGKRHGLGLHHTRLLGLDTQPFEVAVPIEVGVLSLELGDGDDVILSAIVAALLAGEHGGGELSLDVEHRLCHALGVAFLVTGKRHHLLDVGSERLAYLERVGVFLEVIVAVAHRERAWGDVEQVVVAALEVCHHAGVEQGRGHSHVQERDLVGNVVIELFALKLADVLFQRLESLAVEANAVHPHQIEVAHLLRQGASCVARSEAFDEFAKLC